MPFLTACTCGAQMYWERGEHRGLLLLIHSAQLTSSACKVFMTWSEPSNTLFFLLYAGQQKFLPPIDIAGNCFILLMQIGACLKAAACLLCCWEWRVIFNFLRGITAGEDAFQTWPFQAGGVTWKQRRSRNRAWTSWV